MRHALVTTLENTPVIPAVKTPEELPAALRAEGGVVFLLCGDILNIGELIARVHAANRRAVVHADLVAGLAPREIAVDFLQCCGADGIISTRPLLIRRGRELGLLTVLRAFVIDSKAIESLAREAESAAPDVVEMLPAPMPRVVRRSRCARRSSRADSSPTRRMCSLRSRREHCASRHRMRPSGVYKKVPAAGRAGTWLFKSHVKIKKPRAVAW